MLSPSGRNLYSHYHIVRLCHLSGGMLYCSSNCMDRLELFGLFMLLSLFLHIEMWARLDKNAAT